MASSVASSGNSSGCISQEIDCSSLTSKVVPAVDKVVVTEAMPVSDTVSDIASTTGISSYWLEYHALNAG